MPAPTAIFYPIMCGRSLTAIHGKLFQTFKSFNRYASFKTFSRRPFKDPTGGFGVRSSTDANHHPASQPWIYKTWFSRCQRESTKLQIARQSVETTFTYAEASSNRSKSLP